MNTRYIIKAHFRSPGGDLIVPLWHGCHNLFQALALTSFLEKQENVIIAEAFSYEPSASIKPKDVKMTSLTNPWLGLAVRSLRQLAEPADKFTSWTSETRYCHDVMVPMPVLDQGGKLGCLSFYTQHTNDVNAAKSFVDHLFQSRVIAGYRGLSTRSQYVLHGNWLIRGNWVTTNTKYEIQNLIETSTED